MLCSCFLFLLLNPKCAALRSKSCVCGLVRCVWKEQEGVVVCGVAWCGGGGCGCVCVVACVVVCVVMVCVVVCLLFKDCCPQSCHTSGPHNFHLNIAGGLPKPHPE